MGSWVIDAYFLTQFEIEIEIVHTISASAYVSPDLALALQLASLAASLRSWRNINAARFARSIYISYIYNI